ncbi:MAG: hypothetical protein A2X35_04835 [Elusimicrobia bacterium GWA2_61_42]|nr:MAG: hypothetical protein A2X35_04835 [Elusimicrobia bacterium GWA2_61_42]OGR77839.1 MAG: hypothetical protein A2X38_00300 [Elusimicrobia bacterium GWC2_61_25]
MRYWISINSDIFGPLEPEKLAGIKGFSVTTWACPEDAGHNAGDRQWKRAVSFPELAACFFPDYPKAARQPPRLTEEPVLVSAPAAAPEDAAVIAQINSKLDQLLRAPAAKAGTGAIEPLNTNLGAIEKKLGELRDSVALQESRIHSELEPLNRKLDQAEREIEEIAADVRVRPAAVSMEPLSAKLDLAENALEQLKEAVDKQDASIHSDLAPLSERVARTETAIEEENNLQRALLEKLSQLDQDVSGLRDELKHAPGVPAAARAAAHPARTVILTVLVAGAAFIGLYRAAQWVIVQGAHQVNFSFPDRRAKAEPAAPRPDPVLFVKTFGLPGSPLESAIMRDAAARGANPAALSWAEEAGPDGLPRVVAEAPRSRGLGPVYYYFSADIPNKDVVPLNSGSRRVLQKAAGRVPIARPKPKTLAVF